MRPAQPPSSGAETPRTPPPPVTYLDRELVFRVCNASAAAVIGLPCSEVIGRRLEEIVGPDSAMLQAVRAVIETGEPFSGQLECAAPGRPSERRFHVVRYTPDKDYAGTVQGVFTEELDVTTLVSSRDEALRALATSEERFRALVTASSDVLYRMSADWSQMYQLHSERFLASTEKTNSTWLSQYIPPEAQPRVKAAIDQAIRTKSRFDLEHQVYRSDGTVGWTHSRAIPVLDKDGAIVEWFGSASDTTKRRQAELELRRERRIAMLRADRMSLLRDLAQIGASSLAARECENAMAEALVGGLSARVAVIWHAEEHGELLVPTGGAGVDPRIVDELYGPVAIDGETMTAAALRHGRAAYFADNEPSTFSEQMQAFHRALGIRSAIALPLSSHRDIPGVLSISWAEPRDFDEEQLSFLRSVADTVSIGLENARLMEAERRASTQARQELETTSLLLMAAQGLAEATELREALERTATFVLQFTNISRAFVNLIDMERGLLIPMVATGGLSAPGGDAIPFEDLSETARTAVLEKRTTVLDYERPGIADKDREIARANDCKLALFVPLLLHDEVVGHITVDEPGRRHAFSPREIGMVEGIAAQSAVVVRNAQLLHERTRQAELAEALNRINAAIHSTLDFEEIMQRVVVDATKGAGLDGMAIHMLEADRWRVAYAYGITEELAALRLTREQAPLSEAVLATGEPLVIPDSRSDERANAQMMSRFGIGPLMALPLVVRGEAIGVLFAGNYGEDRVLEASQVDFMTKVASTLSLALENARLYQHEHRVADRLQEALLTLPAYIPGIEFAHRYRAAEEAERVGGDFYDLFEVDGEHTGIVIGDVAGKGLDAAMLTSLAKNTIRAHATERGKSPARVLELTSEVVYKSTPGETFMTVFFGVLDCDTGRLVYANAGHTTCAIVRAGGTVTPLEATAPLLGAFQGIPFGESATGLDRDDLLFLYTDGLTEARRGAEFYGEERLLALLSSLADRAAEPAVRTVMRDVFAFAADGLRDDLAVLAIRRT